MSNEINLFITLTDGTVRKITISDKKPIGALFEALIEQEGRPIYSLFKDGVEIPRSREMIKYVPLKNGNSLSEGTGIKPKNIPLASFQNSILKSQIRRGIVSENDVMEIKIYSEDGRAIVVLVRKTATVNDLKMAASELLGREIKELFFKRTNIEKKQTYLLGWSGTITDSLSRVYNGNTLLSSLDIIDQTILYEVTLPKTVQEIEKEKRDKEQREREAKRKQEEEAARREEEFRRYQEYRRQQREHASQPTEDAKEQRCKKILGDEGIVDKASFLRWAIINHPDKFPGVPSEEMAQITEKFRVISACVDLLKIKNIKPVKKGGKRTRRAKKQRRRGRSRKN